MYGIMAKEDEMRSFLKMVATIMYSSIPERAL